MTQLDSSNKRGIMDGHYFSSAWCTLTLLAAASLCVTPMTMGKELPVEGAVGKAVDMQCPPCEQVHCTPRRANRLKCRGGVALGICNCCPVCAKVEGEMCGGAWDYLGKCDRGLVCHVTKDDKSASSTYAASTSYFAMKTVTATPEGICKRVSPNKMLDHNQMDQPSPPAAQCKPACTPEFCSKHKRALCSAVENAEARQPCQGECQHTSCETCRLVPRSTDCGKCAAGDLHCLRQFGKCMQRKMCTLGVVGIRGDKMAAHCRSVNQKSRDSSGKQQQTSEAAYEHKKSNGNFQCIVPECTSP